MMRILAGLLALMSANGCRQTPSIGVRLEPRQGTTRITLLVPPSLKVNARLLPALELEDGRIVRFDQGQLTPDSSYFVSPPFATVPFLADTVHGILRLGVCPRNLLVCEPRVIKL